MNLGFKQPIHIVKLIKYGGSYICLGRIYLILVSIPIFYKLILKLNDVQTKKILRELGW